MWNEVSIALAIVVGLLAVTLLFITRRWRSPSGVRRVDNYALSIEQHDGFQFVHLKVQTDDGRFSAFELEPPMGHALSDELLSATARAFRESHNAAAH